MATKRLSLADRIKASNAANTPIEEETKEKDIVSIVTAKESPDTSTHSDSPNRETENTTKGVRSGSGQVSSVGSRSGQGQVDIVSTQYQHNIESVATQGHDSVRSRSGQGQVSDIESRSGQGQVSSVGSRSGQGQVDTNTAFKSTSLETCVLAPKQQKIYSWFLNNGISGYFNKGQIQRDTGINHPTIRKSIAKLTSLNLIEIYEYNPVSRQQKYQIDIEKNIHLTQGSGQGQVSSIRSRSTQGQVSSAGSRSGQGQVDTNVSANKLVSKFKKLTNFIENSNFWGSQGISEKKCQEWIDEFYPDEPDALLSQMMFAEFAEENNFALQPKNKNKTPVDVFYGCLRKGGMTRPAGFEFPEERAARIRKEELEAQQKILAEQAAIREQEKAMADELAFNEFLKDKDSVNDMIDEMEKKKRFVTPKQKISMKLFREKGQIDSKLEHALKIEFNRDDE